MTGTIKSIFPQKGYGFIDHGKGSVFFHVRQARELVDAFDYPLVGRTVAD